MERNERTTTKTTVTLTEDELIYAGAEACAKMTVKSPHYFLSMMSFQPWWHLW